MNRRALLKMRLLRGLTGVLLLVAALLKAWELVQTPRPIESTGEVATWSVVSPLLLIGFEIAVAGWMFSGLTPRLTRWLGVGLFAIFALVTVTKVWRGDASCGCFGQVEVNPWVTLFIDLGFCLAFFVVPLSESKGDVFGSADENEVAGTHPVGQHSRRWVVLAGFLCLAAVASAFVGWSRPTGTDPAQSPWIEQNGYFMLDPQRWVGQPFPLYDYLDTPDPLRQGSWWVMLYSPTCRHCLETIPKLEAVSLGGQRVALISIPPHADPQYSPQMDSIDLLDRLSETHQWFAQTPVLIELRDGLVIRAVEGEESDGWFSP